MQAQQAQPAPQNQGTKSAGRKRTQGKAAAEAGEDSREQQQMRGNAGASVSLGDDFDTQSISTCSARRKRDLQADPQFAPKVSIQLNLRSQPRRKCKAGSKPGASASADAEETVPEHAGASDTAPKKETSNTLEREQDGGDGANVAPVAEGRADGTDTLLPLPGEKKPNGKRQSAPGEKRARRRGSAAPANAKKRARDDRGASDLPPKKRGDDGEQDAEGDQATQGQVVAAEGQLAAAPEAEDANDPGEAKKGTSESRPAKKSSKRKDRAEEGSDLGQQSKKHKTGQDETHSKSKQQVKAGQKGQMKKETKQNQKHKGQKEENGLGGQRARSRQLARLVESSIVDPEVPNHLLHSTNVCISKGRPM